MTRGAGFEAWSALLTWCTRSTGVTNYKVTNSDLSGTYKKGAVPGCQTASCGLYANEVRPLSHPGRAGQAHHGIQCIGRLANVAAC